MNNKISNLNINVLSTYLMKSFVLINGINLLINYNGTDSIISIILGFIIGFFILSRYISLKEESVFVTIDKSFPKIISLIIKLILIISCIAFTSYSLYSISMFIKFSLLNNMDILPISIIFFLACIYLASKGINTICKSAFITLFISLAIGVISILFLLPNINSLKILPLLTSSPTSIINNSYIYITLSIFPIFLLLCIDKSSTDKNIKKKTKIKRIKLFYILTNIYLIFNFILVLSIIDIKLAKIINYPEFFLLSKISLLNFFDRMESFLCFKLIFDSFFTISLSCYYIKTALESITNKKSNKYIYVVALLLILFLSNFLNFPNMFAIIFISIFGLTNIFISIFN